MAETKHMRGYHTTFDPKLYLETFYSDNQEDEVDFRKYYLRGSHGFWAKLKQSLSRDTTQIRCLEYGGGPCIANLISAAPVVDRIVFAEYTEANRQAVQSWIEGRPDAYDWSHLIEFVLRDLEDVGQDIIAQEVIKRGEELKQKIKSIVSCDVAKDPIVDLECIDQDQPFDVVSTSLCLEVAVSCEEHYKSVVKSLAKFLKPAGYMLMYGVLEETYYNLGEKTLYAFPLTKTMVLEAMTGAGLGHISIDTLKANFSVSDGQGLFIAYGRKTT